MTSDKATSSEEEHRLCTGLCLLVSRFVDDDLVCAGGRLLTSSGLQVSQDAAEYSRGVRFHSLRPLGSQAIAPFKSTVPEIFPSVLAK